MVFLLHHLLWSTENKSDWLERVWWWNFPFVSICLKIILSLLEIELSHLCDPWCITPGYMTWPQNLFDPKYGKILLIIIARSDHLVNLVKPHNSAIPVQSHPKCSVRKISKFSPGQATSLPGTGIPPVSQASLSIAQSSTASGSVNSSISCNHISRNAALAICTCFLQASWDFQDHAPNWPSRAIPVMPQLHILPSRSFPQTSYHGFHWGWALLHWASL